MLAVPVCRFDNQHVGPGEGVRRAQQPVRGAPEVAAAGQGAGARAPGEFQPGPGGAEDVPGVVQRQRGVRCDDGRLARVERGDQAHRAVDVLFGIQRQRRMVLRPAAGIRLLGFLRQQLGAVAEHDLGQFCRVARGVNLAGEALARQRGQVSAVIEMGVGEDHRIDLPGRQRERLPVTPPQLPRPLEQPAVEQDPRPSCLHQEFTAGHRARSAQEGQCRARILALRCCSCGTHVRSVAQEHRPGKDPTPRPKAGKTSGPGDLRPGLPAGRLDESGVLRGAVRRRHRRALPGRGRRLLGPEFSAMGWSQPNRRAASTTLRSEKKFFRVERSVVYGPGPGSASAEV